MAITYMTMPLVRQFQKDSSVTFAIRGDDRILFHIDWLLERYHFFNWRPGADAESKRRLILSDLLMTCKFWLKRAKEGHPRMKKERAPAIAALEAAVWNQLRAVLRCTREEAEQTIDEIYGRSLSENGLNTDDLHQDAKYFSEMERKAYRLRFRGGLAYQYPWWDTSARQTLRPADSSHAFNPEVQRPGGAVGLDGFGGFVMTMDREVYMAKHTIGGQFGQNGVYHSSYTAGRVVTRAGTMLIKAGEIKAVRSDSGHYKPTEQNMAALLQGLSMYGVNLRQIGLIGYDGMFLGYAPEFLASHFTWEKYQQLRAKEHETRVLGDAWRVEKKGRPQFPYLRSEVDAEVAARNPVAAGPRTYGVSNVG
ncbi:MAG TPA: hypothetical protein VGF55_11615 [Gemmataceae bacterium]